MGFRISGAAALLLVLAGCYSVEDVRRSPVIWQATYSAQFDELATCIAEHSLGGATVTPLIRQKQKLATVTISASYSVAHEYSIREVSDGTSEVTWRNAFNYSPSVPAARESRGIADRCGKSA